MRDLSPELAALVVDWVAIAASRGMAPELDLGTRPARDGRIIYVVRCANGHHESYESHESAMRLLIDSHKTRAEDTEAVYARLIAVAGDVFSARDMARDLGATVDKTLPEAERAKLVEAEVARVLVEDAARKEAEAAAVVLPVVIVEVAPTQEELAALAAQEAEDALRAEWWEAQRAAEEAEYQAWKAARVVEPAPEPVRTIR